MSLEWNENLSIGVPEIDAEHKYLIVLVNNFFSQLENGLSPDKILRLFSHLINYTERHFKNEESIMEAIDFPDTMIHKSLHASLSESVSRLSERYINGEKVKTSELMNFLKKWIINHVTVDDKKIGDYIKSSKLPDKWDYLPAYETRENNIFKKCTCCGKEWKSLDEFAEDDSISVIGAYGDKYNPLYNLIITNCSCETTMAIGINSFISSGKMPMKFRFNSVSEQIPENCLFRDKAGSCPGKCACAYTNKILDYLKK